MLKKTIKKEIQDFNDDLSKHDSSMTHSKINKKKSNKNINRCLFPKEAKSNLRQLSQTVK